MRGSSTSRLGLLPAFSFSLRSSLRYSCRYSSSSSRPTSSLIFSCSRLRSSMFSDRYTLSWRCCLRRSFGSFSSSQTDGAASVFARCSSLALPCFAFKLLFCTEILEGVFSCSEADRSVLMDLLLHFLLAFSLLSCDFCWRCLMMSSLQAPVCPSTTVAMWSLRMLSMRFIFSGESSSLRPRSLRYFSWWEMPSLRVMSCRCVLTKRSKSSQRVLTALALKIRITRCISKAADSSNSLKYRMNIVRSKRCESDSLRSNVSSCTRIDFRQQSNTISSFLSTRSLYAFHFYQKRLSSRSCRAEGSLPSSPLSRSSTVP